MKTGYSTRLGTGAWRPATSWHSHTPRLLAALRAHLSRGSNPPRPSLARDPRRLWLLLWPLPTLLLLALSGAAGPSFWPVTFFTMVLLYPATLVTARLFGPRAGAAAGAVLAGLLALRLFVPPPAPAVQPATLERRFNLPTQQARHTIRLPLIDPGWQHLWSRTPEPEAYLYFLVATRAGVVDPSLTVLLGDGELGGLSPRTRLTPPKSAETGARDEQHWHRLPLSRRQLEGQPLLRVTVQPGPGFTPGGAGLGGGYSYHPTMGPTPSEYFDGERWTTDPRLMLPDIPNIYGAPSRPYPHPAAGAPIDPVRYFIELRLIDPQTRKLLAVYY